MCLVFDADWKEEVEDSVSAYSSLSEEPVVGVPLDKERKNNEIVKCVVIQISSGRTVGGMLGADDFVGISDSKECLQKLIDVLNS